MNNIKMFRAIRFFFFLSFLALFIGGGILWFGRLPLLERYLSRALGTKVTIERMSFGWGEVSLHDFKLNNLSYAKTPYAFQADLVTLVSNPSIFFSQPGHFELVRVVNAELNLELFSSNGMNNNWVNLFKRFKTDDNSRQFVIDKLAITNLGFRATRSNTKSLKVPPLPYLELNHVGQKHPLTVSQLSKVVFEVCLHSVTATPHLGSILDSVDALPQELIQGMRSTVSLKEDRGLLKEGFSYLKEKTSAGMGYLSDLFKPKQ